MRLCLTPLLVALSLYGGAPAGAAPLTPEALARQARAAPLTNVAHHDALLSRVSGTPLSRRAYNEYTRLWQKNKQSAHANLWRGVAAQKYRFWEGYPGPSKLPGAEQRALDAAIKDSLAKAVALSPDLAAANREYGFFLWQSGGRQEKGLDLMKKATALDPKDARSWEALGRAYMNPSARTHDPKQAHICFARAIGLDPKYAAPRFRQAHLYFLQGRLAEAEAALNDYVRVAGPEAKQNQRVIELRNGIKVRKRAAP